MTVLWSVVLMTLIASMALTIQRTHSHVARRFIDAALSEVAADSALNLTLLRIGTRDLTTPNAASELRMPTFAQKVSVSIQRERDRVDLNAAGSATLAACFLGAGFSPETARSMASRVIDWRDADDVPGPGGAEEADYHAAGLHYGPRNGPFESVEELRQVLGMDNLRRSVLRLFTVYTHQSDDTDAPDDLAPALPNSGAHCGGSRGPGDGAGGQTGYIGEVVRIRACTADRVHLCRLVVARLTGSMQNPFQIFVWKTVGAEEE